MEDIQKSAVSHSRWLNINYTSLQFVYFMLNCAITSFAAVFLLYNRFQNHQLGIIMALANLVSVLLQPFLTQQVIRRWKISVKTTIRSLILIFVLSMIPLIFIQGNIKLITVCYTIAAIIIITLQPFINSLAFQFINLGYSVNFGASRGAGSLSYAITSYTLGYLLAIFTANSLPIIVVVLAVLLVIPLGFLPKTDNVQMKDTDQDNGNGSSLIDAGHRYPFIIPLFIGFSFIFIFHTIISTSITQVLYSFGGTSKNVGIALMTAGLCELPAMFAFNWLVKIRSAGFWLKLSAIFFLIRAVTVWLAPSMQIVELSQFLQAVSFALFIPSSAYLLNDALRKSDAVLAQTLITAAMTVGAIIANVISGYLLDILGVRSMLFFSMICALFGLIFTIAGLRSIKKIKQ